jgi:hypothetical protein
LYYKLSSENTFQVTREMTMAIFKGRYSWDGKKNDQRDPIAWFPGAYDLKIVDLTEGRGGVTFLKPFLCIYTNTGAGYSISEHPEKFAKRICSDFSLHMDKVLWTEQLQKGADAFQIVTFEKCGTVGGNPFYLTRKRKPLANEINLIKKELAE